MKNKEWSTFTNDITWYKDITDICNTASKRIDIIRRLPPSITPFNKLHIYTTFIRPLLKYGSTLFDNCTTASSMLIEHVQRQAVLAITRAYQHTAQRILLIELGLEHLETWRSKAKLTLFFKKKKNIAPEYLQFTSKRSRQNCALWTLKLTSNQNA